MMTMQYFVAAGVAAVAFVSTAAINAPEQMFANQGAQTHLNAQTLSDVKTLAIVQTAANGQEGAQLPTLDEAPNEAPDIKPKEASARIAMNGRGLNARAPQTYQNASEPGMPKSSGERRLPPARFNPQPAASVEASSAGGPIDLQGYSQAFIAPAPRLAAQDALSPPISAEQGAQTSPAPQAPLQSATQSPSQSSVAGENSPGAITDATPGATTDSRLPNATEPLFAGPSAQTSAGAPASQAVQGSQPSQLPLYAKASMRVAMNRTAIDAANIDIDLFGETVTAVRDRVDRKKAGTVIWHGHVQGNPGEMVTIIARGSAWAGSVDYKGRKFELTGAPGQGLVFNEVDLAALPSNDDDGVDTPPGALPVAGPIVEPDMAPQASGTPPISGAPIEQDLLVVYTDDACAGAGGTPGSDCSQVEAAIVAAVADMNQSYVISQVNIVSNLVGMLEVQYDEDAAHQGEMLSQIRSTSDGVIDNVHTTRDALGADIVSFIVQDGDGYCGQGYRPAHAGSAFSWTMRSCLSNRTQHHEIGHNQGSSHARSQDSNAQPGVYRYGYRRCNNGGVDDHGAPFFRTIMAYSCSGASRTGFFANPNVNHLGVATGVDPNVDPDNAAFSARTLNESAAYMAGFRDPPTGPPPLTPPAAPGSLVATANGTDRIDISWFDNASDETSYLIERSPDASSWAQIATLGADATSYGDNGLNPDTIYYYRVQAENAAGASAWSNTDNATTDPLISLIDDVAIGQIIGTGTISGSFAATRLEDGGVQRIIEVAQSDQTIGFEHSWVFDVTGGVGDVVMTAKVWTHGSEGAHFHYSTDRGATWHLMFTVNESRALARVKRFTMPGGTSGEVLIRMTDAERRQGENPDLVFVDYLGFTSDTLGF